MATVEYVHRHQPSLQSNYARAEAWGIALAASLGFISSVVGGRPDGRWRVTEDGLAFLSETEAPFYCAACGEWNQRAMMICHDRAQYYDWPCYCDFRKKDGTEESK